MLAARSGVSPSGVGAERMAAPIIGSAIVEYERLADPIIGSARAEGIGTGRIMAGL